MPIRERKDHKEPVDQLADRRVLGNLKHIGKVRAWKIFKFKRIGKDSEKIWRFVE